MNTRKVTVVRKHREADDIVSFEMAAADGVPLPPFSAGAHIDVRLAGGTIVRQYSLCNDPLESHRYLIAVLRDPHSRGGSISLHDDVAEGQVLEISEPRNHFPLLATRETVLLAGGIGITPLLCMAERLAHIDARFDLHYCAKSEKRAAFRTKIQASSFAERVHFHFDDGPEDQRLVAATALGAPVADRHAYICGPSGFIDHVISAARGKGWSDGQLHTEYFSANSSDTAKDRAFRVTLASTGETITVPADKSVSDVLIEHGVALQLSCQQGVCGTCITRVLSGKIDHRDYFFTDAEHQAQDIFTPCCSRSFSDLLVLDM